MFGSIVQAGTSATAHAIDTVRSHHANQDAQANASQMAWQNYEWQKEFAQNGLRWKVEDARRAGIHPIFAVGSNAQSFTPSFNGLGAADFPSSERLGQDIGRAISAVSTSKERAETEAYNSEVRDLELQRMNLQNDALRTDIALGQANLSNQVLRTQQAGPPFPNLGPDGTVLPGQAQARQSSLIKVNPAETIANVPGSPGIEAASIPEMSFSRTNDGGYVPIPSSQVKERIEDNLINETLWSLRNQLPAVADDSRVAPPTSWLPGRDYRWVFSLSRGAWYPKRHQYYGYDPVKVDSLSRRLRSR